MEEEVGKKKDKNNGSHKGARRLQPARACKKKPLEKPCTKKKTLKVIMKKQRKKPARRCQVTKKIKLDLGQDIRGRKILSKRSSKVMQRSRVDAKKMRSVKFEAPKNNNKTSQITVTERGTKRKQTSETKKSTVKKVCQDPKLLAPFIHDRRSDLHRAIKVCDHKKIKQILRNGERICVFSNGTSNLSCFDLALDNLDWMVTKTLIDFDASIINVGSSTNETFLTRFIKDPGHVKYLLDRGANPHFCGSAEKNALVDAATEEAPLIVFKMLINCGIDLNKHNSFNQTPVFIVSKNGKNTERVPKLKLLLNAGADVNIPDFFGRTALMCCMETVSNKDILSVTKMFLQAGANVHLESECYCKEITVLHFAIKSFKKRLEVQTGLKTCQKLLDILVKAGCDLHIENRRGKTPFAQLLHLFSQNDSAYALVYQMLNYMTNTNQHVYPVDSQCHPQKLVLENLAIFVQEEHFSQILHLLFQSPYKSLGMTVRQKFKCFCVKTNVFQLNTMGVVIFNIEKIDILKYWVKELIRQGFTVEHENPAVLSPITALIWTSWNYDTVIDDEIFNDDKSTVQTKLSMHHEVKKQVLSVLQYLVKNGGNVTQRIFEYKIDTMNQLSEEYNLPDSIWAATVEDCNSNTLAYLMSFWAPHPMTLMMFSPPWPENEIYKPYDEKSHAELFILWAFPTLTRCGGWLPRGTELHRKFEVHIRAQIEKYMDDKRHTDVIFEYLDLKAPSSLKLLSRHAIRNSVGTGNDLPEKLNSVMPHFLQDYASLKIAFNRNTGLL